MGGKSSTPSPSNSETKQKLAREKFMKAHNKTFGGATISMAEARELERKGQKVVFVDIRTRAEQQVSRFPKSIDEEEFWKNKKLYKDAHVVSYCTIGFRSGVFAQKLKRMVLHLYINSFHNFSLNRGILTSITAKALCCGHTTRRHSWSTGRKMVPKCLSRKYMFMAMSGI